MCCNWKQDCLQFHFSSFKTIHSTIFICYHIIIFNRLQCAYFISLLKTVLEVFIFKIKVSNVLLIDMFNGIIWNDKNCFDGVLFQVPGSDCPDFGGMRMKSESVYFAHFDAGSGQDVFIVYLEYCHYSPINMTDVAHNNRTVDGGELLLYIDIIVSMCILCMLRRSSLIAISMSQRFGACHISTIQKFGA